MLTQEQRTTIKDQFDKANSIIVIMPAEPNLDQITTAASLFLSLKGRNKDVAFVSPQPVAKRFQEIYGLEMLEHKLGKQNLVAAFDYQPEQVDKVSYHIGEETKKFYLTIKPKKGVKPLSSDNVEFLYTGAEADIVFLIGVHEYESLDKLYFGFESLYEEASVISINTFETEIGDIKIDTSSMLSMSEALFDILDELELPITSEISTNLYMTLQYKTNNFTSLAATADTFEIAAELIRSGARRRSDLVKQLLDSDNNDKSSEKKEQVVKTNRSKKHKNKEQQVRVEKNNQNSKPKKQNKKSKHKPQVQGSLKHQPGGFVK